MTNARVPDTEKFLFEVTEPIYFDEGDYVEFEAVNFFPVLNADKFASQSHFDGVVIAIFVGTRDGGLFLGSAVIIAPGVALGAKHVITDHLSELQSGSISITAFGFGHSNRADIWRVANVRIDESHDVAVYSLIRTSAPPKNRKFRQAILSTRLPAIGEAVMFAGFRPEQESISPLEGGELNLKGSVGLVSNHYLSGRDSSMIPWPCFQVDVGTPGALSGGPVFDKFGDVVGVLCSSMGTDGDGYSIASMIHPALPMPFKPHWPNALYSESETVFGLNQKICRVNGREALSVSAEPTGNIVWKYRAWTD